MHRVTPLNTSFRAYTSGGSRSVVDQVDDTQLMQEMAGNFMHQETQDQLEAPQNYGFTSVVRDATNKAIGDCAEAFISFMGGNRSFPVCTVMDDRRFRLKDLAKGDVAMFDYLQHQLHMNNDGVFLTGRTDKKVKIQLAPPPQQDQSGGASPASAATFDASSSGGGGQTGGQTGSQKKGQQQRYKQSTKQYLEMTKDSHNFVHDKTINYKSGTHIFQPPDSASVAAQDIGGALVKILGDKFTQGYGEFTKQVTAAAAILPQHLVTKGYIDSMMGALLGMLKIPSLPIPGFPSLPNILPIPIPIPHVSESADASQQLAVDERLAALEARIKALEQRTA